MTQIIDLPDNTLVRLPNGKLDRNQERKLIKKQTTMGCLLFALRRIALRTQSDLIQDDAHSLFHGFRKIIITYGSNENILLEIKELCQNCKIDLLPKILENEDLHSTYFKFIHSPYYNFWKSQLTLSQFYETMPLKNKLALWQAEIIRQVINPSFQIMDSGWNPESGVEGLKKSLREHGPHVFIGKFGKLFHTEFGPYPSENFEDRLAFGFPKGSYIGETKPWLHTVIVDQVKLIKGSEKIFFHDPFDESKEGEPEKVYILSYDSFVQRLTNIYGRRYINNECNYSHSFGYVSQNPEKAFKLKPNL